MNSLMEKKKYWPDYLRAIATISVIWLHVSAPILYKFGEIPFSIWQIGNIYDSIVRFCVPIFFMISGALLLNKDYDLKEFIVKRVVRIFPPFIFWSLIYILYNSFVVGNGSFEFIAFIKNVVLNLLHGSEYHLWFVYTLIGLYLLTPILRPWIKSATKNELRYFLIIWLITILYGIPELTNYLPTNAIENFSGYIGYFVLGYYLSKHVSLNKYILILCFFLGVLLTILLTYKASSAIHNFDGFYYNYLTFNVILCSISIFLFIKQVKIKSESVKNVLSLISKYSFGIYLSHVLILNLLKRIGLSWDFIHPIISIPIIVLLCLSISTLIIYLGNKVKYLNFYIG